MKKKDRSKYTLKQALAEIELLECMLDSLGALPCIYEEKDRKTYNEQIKPIQPLDG